MLSESSLTFSGPFSPICRAVGDEGRGSCGLSLMPLVMPGLWKGSPFSLACSALEPRHVLSHSGESPHGCSFVFRADSPGLANPQFSSELTIPSSEDPWGLYSAVTLACTHRGCSSLAAALPLAAWSWLRWRRSTSLAGDSLV